MLSQQTAVWLERRNIHYGWLIVLVAFLVMLTTAGSMGLPGAFILPLSREFGWNTAEISGALALRLLIFGLMAPFSAALIDRYGIRRIVTAAIALIAAGLFLSWWMTSLWQLVVLWGMALGFGSGLTATVLGAVVANRWFTAHRGLALGLLMASAASGQLAFLPLAAWLEQKVGWRLALLPPLVCLFVVALLVLLFMRDRPSDVNLPPLGETAIVPPPAPSGQNAVVRAFSLLGEASLKPTFWVLAATFFVCGMSTAGLIQTHLITFCADFGMRAVEAASVLALMGAFDFVGTIASGWLSDRFDNRWLLFWYYGLRGLSLLYLPSSTFTFYGLSLFAVFYGLDWLATVPPTVRLTGVAMGREKAPVIFGWIFAAHQIGASLEAFSAGWSRTALQTYLPAFYTAGAACLVAAVACLMIGRSFGSRRSGEAAAAAS